MAQDGVAGRVAVRVVEPLEVVEVDDDHRQLAAIPVGAQELVVEPRENGLAVGDAGQRVDGREAPRVGDAVGELAEGDAQARVGDALRLERHERALVRGAGQALGEPRDAPVLVTLDHQRVPGRSRERPDEHGDEQHDSGGNLDVQWTSREQSAAAMRPLFGAPYQEATWGPTELHGEMVPPRRPSSSPVPARTCRASPSHGPKVLCRATSSCDRHAGRRGTASPGGPAPGEPDALDPLGQGVERVRVTAHHDQVGQLAGLDRARGRRRRRAAAPRCASSPRAPPRAPSRAPPSARARAGCGRAA